MKRTTRHGWRQPMKRRRSCLVASMQIALIRSSRRCRGQGSTCEHPWHPALPCLPLLAAPDWSVHAKHAVLEVAHKHISLASPGSQSQGQHLSVYPSLRNHPGRQSNLCLVALMYTKTFSGAVATQWRCSHSATMRKVTPAAAMHAYVHAVSHTVLRRCPRGPK